MVTGWWGRNYDSTGNEKPAFVGVADLWDFATANTGNGPRATGYNDNSVYTNISTTLRKGDVLQFWNPNATSYYGHSALNVYN
jgi:hypothetical protein